MKGIYLTQEVKQELEKRLNWMESQEFKKEEMWGRIFMLRELLSSPTILPVVDDWEGVSSYITPIEGEYFPNGVIIQHKQ